MLPVNNHNSRILKNLTSSTLLIFLLSIFMACGGGEEGYDTSKLPPDEEIVEAIQTNLRQTRGIEQPDQIRVESSAGVIILSGEASNLLAKDRATDVAESVKGVRSVVNNLEVQDTRPDTAVASDVEEALNEDPVTEDYNIRTQVSGGVVTLMGQVDSWQEKQLAAQVIKGVKGVTEIQNNIEVDYDETRSASEIREDVQQTTKWTARLDAEMLSIEVQDDTVILSGSVGSAYEKSLAERKAHVAGVQNVDTGDLTVKPWLREDMKKTQEFSMEMAQNEAGIKGAVTQALVMDPRVDAENIDVEVAGGHVTLSGAVDNVKAKNAAEADARNTFGVYDVTNGINVDPQTDIADGVILNNVRKALQRSPYVEFEDVNVNVQDGVVEISGIADSYFEKWKASEAAVTVNGVLRIENNMEAVDEQLGAEDDFIYYNPVLHYYDYGAGIEQTPTTDEQIKDRIIRNLRWSPFVDREDINVTVEDGVATLSGEADNWYDMREAVQQAKDGGAVEVVNELTYTDMPDITMEEQQNTG